LAGKINLNQANLKKEIKSLSDKKIAESNLRFFKTDKGEYGEGDKFLGLSMAKQRSLAKKYKNLSFAEVKKFLDSKFHEERMIGLLVLVFKYEDKETRRPEKKKIFDFYIKNKKAANNWDLVDTSAPNIVGCYLKDKKERKILYKMVNSKNLWDKRIAVLATYGFIKERDLEDIIKMSSILLQDQNDLIHKAVGWMLREAGKKDIKILEKFLNKHGHQMPRTMLRYAIEKFPERKRQHYLHLREKRA